MEAVVTAINVPVTDEEQRAIYEMADLLSLTPDRVMIQALRVYQLVTLGGGKVTMPSDLKAKRDLVFVRDDGMLGEALGLDPERVALIDRVMNDAIQQGMTLRQTVEMMNEQHDLTDAEWTTMVYALGWFQAMKAAGR